jgi:uncharacterized repeat protein (TIGR03803 family)
MRRPSLGVFLLAIAFATPPNAQSSLTTIWSFTGADGNGPSGPLVFDSNGEIYGTTETGGTSNSGTVFQLTPPAHGGAPGRRTCSTVSREATTGGNLAMA